MERAAGVVIFDLEMVAAGLAKIDRVGEMRALRLGDLAEMVLLFMRLYISPGGLDFFVAATRKP